MFTQNLSTSARAPWNQTDINSLVLLSLTSLVLIYLTAIFFYNMGLNIVTAEAMTHNIKMEEANSLLYMTTQEKKEYKVYLQEVQGPENFQYFDEWQEHKVFTWTLSDLRESN